MIEPFSFHLPVRIRFGEGVIAGLPEVLAELGARSVTVVCEQPVADLPAVAAATAGLDVYRKPPGEPTAALVDALVERMKGRPPDALVAIGGGSALDLAKGARAAYSQGVAFARLLCGDVAVAEPRIGLVTVPTTSGTGSEVSGGVVVVDPHSGRKLGVASPLMRAQHALVDPLLTLGLPAAATMQTGADALAQAIGGVIVRNGNPGSVALGLEACGHVAAAIGPAVADGGDRAARSRLSLGSLLAGLAMNLSDCGADHALGHALGGRLGLPHGLSVGLVLAETLDVDRAACPQALERVADALGEPAGGPPDGSRAVRAVRRILGAIGFPTCAAAGVGADDVEALVAVALDDYCLTVSPHMWSEADVRGAYAAALAWGRAGRPPTDEWYVLHGPSTVARGNHMRIRFENHDLDTEGCGQFIDLTDDVVKVVERSKVREGMAVVYSPHTTCAVLINERESGFIEDFGQMLDTIAPRDGIYYRHDDLSIRTEGLEGDPHQVPNGHSHCRAALMGSASQTIPVVDGKLTLGRWQKIFFCELDRARQRKVFIQVIGEE